MVWYLTYAVKESVSEEVNLEQRTKDEKESAVLKAGEKPSKSMEH